jgi:hypothetical protein
MGELHGSEVLQHVKTLYVPRGDRGGALRRIGIEGVLIPQS